jgi:hypothetical protein
VSVPIGFACEVGLSDGGNIARASGADHGGARKSHGGGLEWPRPSGTAELEWGLEVASGVMDGIFGSTLLRTDR